MPVCLLLLIFPCSPPTLTLPPLGGGNDRAGQAFIFLPPSGGEVRRGGECLSPAIWACCSPPTLTLPPLGGGNHSGGQVFIFLPPSGGEVRRGGRMLVCLLNQALTCSPPTLTLPPLGGGNDWEGRADKAGASSLIFLPPSGGEVRRGGECLAPSIWAFVLPPP